MALTNRPRLSSRAWFKTVQSNKDQYGVFVWSVALEDIKKVLDEVKEFRDYNPSFAREMCDKIIQKVNDTRAQLAPL